MVNLWLLGTLVCLACFSASVYADELVGVEDSALKKCILLNTEKSSVNNYKQLKSLKCHNKGIQSLVGIDVLENLESLSLFSNRISSADLSKLKLLNHVNLAKNTLVFINIEGLSKLKTLYLFKNKLSSIDFSGVISLEKMRAMENQLTILDISPLKSIQEIYLWDNQLEDLQITGLNTLTFLDVKQNPMPDKLYDFYDEQAGITIVHDGNAEDWK